MQQVAKKQTAQGLHTLLMDIGQAFRRMYEEAGHTQIPLAEALGVDQRTVSRWGKGTPIPLDKQIQAEQLCGHGPGYLFRVAGLITDDRTVEEILTDDPALDETRRAMVLDVYQVARRQAAQARGENDSSKRPPSRAKKARS